MEKELRKINIDELKKILESHKKMLSSAKQNAEGRFMRIEDLGYFRNIDLKGANLMGVDLTFAYLTGSDLRNANLRNVNLACANCNEIDLRGADLKNANFINTNFAKANLSDLNFSETKIGTPTLIDANLKGSNFSNINLCNTEISGADLSDANFSGVNFKDADLDKVIFGGVDFSNANLKEQDLRDANLSGVNLSGANLILANLNNANLSNANITGANLYGTIRDDWKIEGIKCDYVYWDSDGKERTPKDRNFQPGEFEKLYKILPEFIYYFEHGFTPIDPIIMELIVTAVNEKHPEFELDIVAFDKRGTPHAKFTIKNKQNADKALEEITSEYETRLKILEEKNEQLMKLMSMVLNKPNIMLEKCQVGIIGDNADVKNGIH